MLDVEEWRGHMLACPTLPRFFPRLPKVAVLLVLNLCHMESRRPLNPSSCPTAMKYGTVTRGICPFRVAGRPGLSDAIGNLRGFNQLVLSFSVQISF